MFFKILLIIFLIVGATGCDSSEDLSTNELQPRSPEIASGSYAPVRETIAVSGPQSNLLDHTLNLIGLTPSDLARPPDYEDGYMLACRFPLIDQLSLSPFYLHHWADGISEKLQKGAQKDLMKALSIMIETLNGGITYGLGPDQHSFFKGGFVEAYRYLCGQYAIQPEKAAIEAIYKSRLSVEFDRQMGDLLHALADATVFARRSVANLNRAEADFISAHPEKFFFPVDSRFNFLTAPTYVQQRIVSITRKIDFNSLYSSAVLIAGAIDRFTSYLKRLENPADPDNFFETDSKHTGVVLHLSSPIGDIILLGQDDNRFDGAGALVIDLGGNDQFSGPLAVGHQEPGRVSVFIDHAGNDIYNRQKKSFSQGFGCLSVGMMVDVSGNDRYLAGDMAQGSGMFGVGVLADLKGEDFFEMGLMGQGFGVFGIGMLADANGNDKYNISGMGQGAGSTLGFGCLLDLKGDDEYRADREKSRGNLAPDKWAHVQGSGFSIRSHEWRTGFSFYGGIGFLSEGGGDDLYVSSNENCMGSSYFMSIGGLVDHEGSDTYIPLNGNGMAFAVHLSNAVLIDRKGNDRYFAKHFSGGSSADRSVAILADYQGNDFYGPSEESARMFIKKEFEQENNNHSDVESKAQARQQLADTSYGSVGWPKSLAFLIDYGGDDRYFARPNGQGESCGGVIPPAEPRNWSHAILLDLNGKDFYYLDGRQDNHFFRYDNHGLCYDTEYGGAQVIAKTAYPQKRRGVARTDNLLELSKNTSIYDEVRRLLDPNLFARFTAIGNITQKTPEVVFELIAILTRSQDTEFNRDLIEALNHFIVRKMFKPRHGQKFFSLLNAEDPYVRRYAARTLGWWRVKSALPALVEAFAEQNEYVRSDIIWATGQMGTPDVSGQLARLADDNPSLECRRAAIQALRDIVLKMDKGNLKNDSNILEVLLRSLNSPDEIIRVDAASALSYFGDDAEVLDRLKSRLTDESVYVRRAAAKSIILNGLKEGIAILIESLKYRSIDTFAHYDQELVKDLAYYAGIDFPPEKRYAHETWKRWWQANGSGVDLKRNLAIMNDITRAFNAPDEETGIAIFERLIDQNPENVVVKRRYQRFCYEWITFRLLTKENVTDDILKRCLRLQKIMTELEPENPRVIARLAYFYARLNQFDDAISSMKSAIKIDSNNPNYHKRLKRYMYLNKRTKEKEI